MTEPKVEFAFDEPVTVHLREAKIVPSRYFERWSGDTTQWLFVADEGCFYLSDTAGGLLHARLRSRGYIAGEPVTITKIRVPNPNSSRPVTEYMPEVLEPRVPEPERESRLESLLRKSIGMVKKARC